MKIHFLGTAASEGVPNPFCHCEICQSARRLKGKELRTRSSALIDDVMLIDIAPEFAMQVNRDNIDGTALTHLLFTHTHPDHFNVGELYSRMEGFAEEASIRHPLSIFGNDRAINGCLSTVQGYSAARFAFRCLIPFVSIETGGYKITPLLANHAKWELCYVYLIEKEGKSIFYGHDSGWFPELTWQWLQGKKLDLVVLECTHGFMGNDRTDNHMSVETVLAAQQKLKDIGCLTSSSQLVLSHFSHSSKLSHEQMSEIANKNNMLVAYDGLTLSIN